MSDQDARLLDARFAAISGKTDYWSIIDTLLNISREHSVTLPDFAARTLRFNAKFLSSPINSSHRPYSLDRI
jgi:hypothetical protein